MNLLKKCFFSAVLFSSIIYTSCDKECSPPDITENIIGDWDLCNGSTGAFFTFTDEGGYVVSAGIFTPENNSIYEVTESQVIITDTLLNRVRVHNIVANKCDEVRLEIDGQAIEYCRRM